MGCGSSKETGVVSPQSEEHHRQTSLNNEISKLDRQTASSDHGTKDRGDGTQNSNRQTAYSDHVTSDPESGSQNPDRETASRAHVAKDTEGESKITDLQPVSSDHGIKNAESGSRSPYRQTASRGATQNSDRQTAYSDHVTEDLKCGRQIPDGETDSNDHVAKDLVDGSQIPDRQPVSYDHVAKEHEGGNQIPDGETASSDHVAKGSEGGSHVAKDPDDRSQNPDRQTASGSHRINDPDDTTDNNSKEAAGKDNLEQFRLGTGKDFFAKFVTPTLLVEAQSVYTSLNFPVSEENDVKGPFPTPSMKDAIFKLEEFEAVDLKAIETPVQACFWELETLVTHLISPTQSDIGWARAIFRWIANQDVKNMTFVGNQSSSAAACYLARIKANQGGYTEIFSEMCRLANIPRVTISGYVKAAGYEPGNDLTGENGSWSAVYLSGAWRFVDAHWGSTHLEDFNTGEYELVDDGSGQKNPSKAVVSAGHREFQYNETYFLTNPHEFIYSHWPQDEKWQLLARPVSFEEFKDMAYLKEKFFDLGFNIHSHPKCVLVAENGTCLISLKLPVSGGRTFTYNLYRSVKAGNVKSISSVNLDRYVFLEVIKDKAIVRARVNFPSTGQFKLQLFSKDTSSQSRDLKAICAYAIHCDKPSEIPPEPFPPNSRKEWGPGTDMEDAGITPLTHTSGVVETDDGEVELRFHIKKDMEFLHEFVRDDAQDKKHQNYVFHRFEDDQVVFRVRVPEKGKYALSLFAREAGQDGTFPSICTYMVDGDDASDDPMAFPDTSNGRIGPNAQFSALGLTADGPMASGFFVVGESGELEMKFKLSQPLLFIPHLYLQTTEGERDLSEYCTFVSEGDMVTFRLRFPEDGMYKFSLFGKSPGTDESYPFIYNALIQADYPKIGAFPFAKMFGGKSYRVLEPQSGYLPTNETVKFLAKIPDANGVAIIDEGKWTRLIGSDEGLWEGQFETGETERDIQLFACQEPESNSFSALLCYKVVSQAKLDDMRRTQEQQFLMAQEKKTRKAKRKRGRTENDDDHSTKEETTENANIIKEEQQRAEAETQRIQLLEEERKNAEVERVEQEKVKKEEEERIRQEEEMRIKKEEEDRVKKERIKQEEEERIKQEEEEKIQNEEEERIKQAEEERIKQEEERIKQAEEERIKQEEEERIKQEEEYKKEEGRKKQEEEEKTKEAERKKQEEIERQEEADKRKRAEEERLIKEEEEQVRKRKEEELIRMEEEERVRREEQKKKEEEDRIKKEAEEDLRRLDEQEKEAIRQAAELEDQLKKAKSEADREEMKKQQKQTQELMDRIAIDRLKAAMKNQDRFTLEVAVQDFKTRGLKQKHGELDEAERLLDMLILRDELYLAMAEKNVKAMKDAISRIERKGHLGNLQFHVSQARNKIRQLEKMATLNTVILNMDSKLMTEIRRYNNPPTVVHQVMIASLLLLGKHEGITRVWKKCQKYCNPSGPDGLNNQVREFDVDQLHPEIAARAEQIINDLDLDLVRQCSAGAATFYIWCNGMVDEVSRRSEENGDDFQPADKARQKEIFQEKSNRGKSSKTRGK